MRVAVHETVPKDLIRIALGEQARHGGGGQSQAAQTRDIIDANAVDEFHQHDATRGVHDRGELDEVKCKEGNEQDDEKEEEEEEEEDKAKKGEEEETPRVRILETHDGRADKSQ